MIINYRALASTLAVSFLALSCRAATSEHPEAFQGVVELTETVLSFELGGRLQKLHVEAGQRVDPQSVIGVLDDGLVRAARTARALEAEAARWQADLVRTGARREDVRALEAQVRAAAATEAQLEKQLLRQRILVEQKALTQASLDEIEGQFARARAERESLESQLGSLVQGARRQEREGANSRAQAAEATLQIEEQRLSRHLLHATVSGRVLDLHVEAGEVVAAGTPIVTVGDTLRPYLEVFVPQPSVSGIRVGEKARVRVDSEAHSFAGKVEQIARRAEFTPRFIFSERERPNMMIRVRVRVDDPSERLHAGVPGFVTFGDLSKAASQ